MHVSSITVIARNDQEFRFELLAWFLVKDVIVKEDLIEFDLGIYLSCHIDKKRTFFFFFVNIHSIDYRYLQIYICIFFKRITLIDVKKILKNN